MRDEKRVSSRFDLSDIVIIAGFCLLTYGTFLQYELPPALIVGGFCISFLGFLAGRSK